MNYLDLLPASAQVEAISTIHHERQRWVNQNKKGFLRFREPCEALCRFPAQYLDFASDTVSIGHPDEQPAEKRQLISQQLRAFMPWRKGPFAVYGTEIDAEWRSEKKWARLIPHLPPLGGKVVADVGCNNGYYMFRMQHFRPKLVLGFEPTVQHYYCFKALNGMARQDNLQIDLLGVEHIQLFPQCFDVIFLMGVIYHRPSPIDTLRDLLTALKPGGTLIVETQVIPGEEPVALFPQQTYAKVPGTYFVPTGPCLVNWLTKAGFTGVELFGQSPMSGTEQRRTDWMAFESYSDFLQPDDPTMTVEGYPAPWRLFAKATRKN